MTSSHPRVSVVAPMFNEAGGITQFCHDLRPVLSALDVPYEVLLIDDGSVDESGATALSLEWPELTVVTLARNVGHQEALEAGLALSRGDLVITMDSDGQHPAALIPPMIHTAEESGVDVVYTQRTERREDSWGKRTSALSYYRLVRWLTGVPIADSQADFRLMTRRVLESLGPVRGDRVLRMLLPYLGFTSATLEFQAQERISGRGRYGLRRQISLGLNSIVNFSSRPLRLVAAMGWLLSLASLIWLAVVVVTWLTNGAVVGWTSVMTAVLFVGAMSLLGLSIVGAYLARIYDILKGYPRYIVSDVRRTSDGNGS